jgi:recombination protein RecA
LPELTGRLCELCGRRASAALTLAASLILDAQRREEGAAWIGTRASTFFPPDLAASGIDLAALPIVRVARPGDLSTAADFLVRSGAFGLVVLDLPPRAALPLAVQTRLAGLAREHRTAVVLLTPKSAAEPSQGSLVSLRGDASFRRLAPPRGPGAEAFACDLRVSRDKRRARGWSHGERFHGPPGLR